VDERKPKSWFESDRNRLVQEYRLVRSAYPDFELKFIEDLLVWEGETTDSPPSVDAPPLRFRVEYPTGFPVAAIKVFPISPELPPKEWGHEWHRWEDGRVCIVRPNRWDISYTARDVIEKVADWYFNYLAYKNALISEMPDTGRARLVEE
jgi:hypothetical protein